MNVRDIDLNLLVVFDAVYKHRSISRAAESLDLSQPGMSNALSRLRKNLDDPLFVRSGHGVMPTGRAEAIASSVMQALSQLNDGLHKNQIFDPQKSDQRFRIMMPDPLEPIIMPSLIKNIQNESKIRIELIPVQSMNIEEAILSDVVDVALFVPLQQHESVASEILCPLNIVFVARKEHPIFDQLLDPATFSQYKQVALNLKANTLVNMEKVQLTSRTPFEIACFVNRLNSIPHMVANSDLLGGIPAIYAHEMAKYFDLEIIRLPMPIGTQQFTMSWSESLTASPSHQWLRSEIRTAITGYLEDSNLQ